MTNLSVKQIANGIFRMRDAKSADKPTLSERYGIVKAVCEACTDNASFDIDTGVLAFNGKSLKISFRPDQDDEFWAKASGFVLEKFKDRHLNTMVAEGNPNTDFTLPEDSAAALVGTDVHFGAAFEVGEKERFYGLGEASRDKLELRGRAYQNWTYYQYNEIPIPYFMSSAGWGVLINAAGRHFVDVCEQYDDKVIISGECDSLDIFVLYGSMHEMLKSLAKLTGKSMMLPGWAYGLTYVAPIHADQFEVIRHAERFRDDHIPVDMFSLEPGWMKTFYDYSLNTEWDMTKFHMPEWHKGRNCPNTFVAGLRRMGIHLSLWFCDSYDLTDEAERIYRGDDNNTFEPWYNHLGKQVDFGIDGFKLDPADFVWKCHPDLIYSNGVSQMQMHNLNQVLLTKQVYEGFKAQTGLRPMHHYCGGYIGSAKWSAATTGDNGGEHGAMIWLLTLAMSGFSNTTIDMHIFSPESLHFGFLVPWAHLNAWSGLRQPWWAGKENYEMFKYYDNLRYSLFPYIYSNALEAHEDAMPMIRPLPLMFPEFEAGFDNVCEYMFGPSLLVCAYTDTVILPEGVWQDYFTGKIYDGPCQIKLEIPENRGGALFVKRGAIIPMMGKSCDCIRDYDNSTLILDIYPEGESKYILREDDMETLEYENTESAHTVITCKSNSDETIVTIGAPSREYAGSLTSRNYNIKLHGNSENITVICERSTDTYTVEYTEI